MKPAIDERKIFSEMSAALRMEVSAYIVSVQMSAVKIFQTMNPMLWSNLLPLLKPLRFDVGETVCTQHDECSEMYIVLNGELVGSSDVKGEAHPRVREIGMGDSINILTVLRVWDRCIETVVVVGARFVESYAVSASDFYDLFEHDVSLVFVHSDFGGCCYWLTVANVATGISHIDTPLLLGCSANQIKMNNEK